MPESAVTGTKTARKPKAEKVGHDLVDGSGDAPEMPVPEPQPLADPNGNGSIQATAPDGSITNIDASQPGWEAEVRAIDPKHPVLKYADKK